MVLARWGEAREKARDGWRRRHCEESGVLRGRVVINRDEENCLRDAWVINGDVSAPRSAVNLAKRLIAWFRESPCDAMVGGITVG
jgi:hypothetical protein